MNRNRLFACASCVCIFSAVAIPAAAQYRTTNFLIRGITNAGTVYGNSQPQGDFIPATITLDGTVLAVPGAGILNAARAMCQDDSCFIYRDVDSSYFHEFGGATTELPRFENTQPGYGAVTASSISSDRTLVGSASRNSIGDEAFAYRLGDLHLTTLAAGAPMPPSGHAGSISLWTNEWVGSVDDGSLSSDRGAQGDAAGFAPAAIPPRRLLRTRSP